MPYVPIPENSILSNKEYLGYKNNQKLWRSRDKKRHYTWDKLHGEIEVFDKNGYHLGSIHPKTGVLLKGSVKGRKINVK